MCIGRLGWLGFSDPAETAKGTSEQEKRAVPYFVTSLFRGQRICLGSVFPASGTTMIDTDTRDRAGGFGLCLKRVEGSGSGGGIMCPLVIYSYRALLT